MIFRTLRSKCALLVPVCLLVLGAAGKAAADTITVEWDQGEASVGYKVHVGSQSGSYTQHFDVGSANLFAFTSATAGQRYCFAVSAYLLSSRLDGPNSNEVCGYSNAPPTLVNPGNRTSTVGQAVTLQLQGSDPASEPVTYTATGLPPGLSLQASTGFISGAGTTAGTYSVTARASDGVLTSAAQTFTWTMSAAGGGGGTTPPPPTGPDGTRPVVTISSPTSASTYTMSGTAITLSGTTSDNVGVTQVRWENDTRNMRGVANGLTNWTTSVPVQTGSNLIYITAIDAAGNEGVDILTVTVSGTGGGTPDTTAPTASISSPTSGSSYSTTLSTINLTGSAADNRGVTQVSWSNSGGGSGVASGTTSWAMSNIPLQTGTNVITVTAVDAAGNRGTDTLTVTRSTSTTPPPTNPPPTGSVPTLSLSRVDGNTVRLSWTQTSWSSVDVWAYSPRLYAYNYKVKNTSNSGSTTVDVPRTGYTYTFKVCAPGSTTVCSNSVNISF
jgi:hypothetical protein